MFKTRYMNERTKYHQLRYKHQLEKEKNRRLRNKVSHLKEVKNFSGLPLAIIERMLANSRRGKTVRQKYDEVIRSFAMTLHFTPAKLMNMSENIQLSTSFTAVIRGWFSNISCEPGFSQPAFDSLKTKVADYKTRGKLYYAV
ncbi:hypothetical protein JTB14_033335 [Gonioctena quinquepunctata]|nr:hypothetical protein JTB14_033335 [Gonioctena quinquepunctata]